MKLTSLVFSVVSVLSVTACTSSQQVAVTSERLNESARRIVGTSLIGAAGATASDQDKIDDTVAGLCGAQTWTKAECLKHEQSIGKR